MARRPIHDFDDNSVKTSSVRSKSILRSRRYLDFSDTEESDPSPKIQVSRTSWLSSKVFTLYQLICLIISTIFHRTYDCLGSINVFLSSCLTQHFFKNEVTNPVQLASDVQNNNTPRWEFYLILKKKLGERNCQSINQKA